MTNILIVDDHAIVRSGIKRLLTTLPNVDVHETTTGQDTLQLLRATPVQLLILDLNLPGLGGLELLRRILLLSPNTAVLIFSMNAEAIYAARAIQAGARGYVSKNAAPEELLAAIEVILKGGSYIEQEIAAEIDIKDSMHDSYLKPLTKRDLEIIRLLVQGHSLSQIADTLGVAYKTVANTCSHIKEKVGVTTTADLIRISIGHGLV